MTRSITSEPPSLSSHVLVAEDSATQAYLLREQLEGAGYRVTVAADGAAALRAVSSGNIDAVVSDVVMPGLDGYELCRRLKASPELSAVPILLLTTLRDPLDVVRALEAGADGFLTKPAPAAQLIGRLEALLETRGQRAAAEPGPVLDVRFLGRRIGVSSDRQQVVDVLMSSFEELIRTNDALREREDELARATSALEHHLDVAERARLRLDRSLDLSGVGAFEYDLDRGAILWAEHVEPLYGLPGGGSEPVDRGLVDRVHPDDRERVRELLAAATPRVDPDGRAVVREFEYRVMVPDGALRWLRLRYAVTSERRMVGVAMDVTAEVTLQQDLAEARDEAQRADGAKTEFLARMSHELRTPLNAVLGFGELLRGAAHVAAEDRESAGHIVAAGQHLLQLIDEVLDISRIESGNVDVGRTSVDVAAIVDESVRMLRAAAAEREVTVRVATAEALHVTADPRRFQQVVLNLVSNAIKYNRRGGAVDIRWHGTEDGRAVLDVQDTGVGLRDDQRERLFTPFDRLGAEGTDVEGTGLGLVLTAGLVELMDGTLEVCSEVDVGSTFTVRLPLADPTGPRGTSAATPAEPRPVAAEVTGTVVHIEDQAANRALMRRVLRRRPSVELLDAEDGAAGAALVRQVVPDLVLLDLQLPGVSGPEVLAQLRRDPATAEVPVVVLSADASPGRADQLRAIGAQGFLTKPFGLAALLEVIDAVLQDRPLPSDGG